MHGGFTTGAALALSIFCIPAWAGRIDVSTADNLQSKIDSAAPGDVIHLSSGEHVGRVHLKESLTLEGEPGAVLRGRGKGSVITVDGHDATVRGLIVRGSGRSLEKMDSGVFLERTASRAVVERNVLEDNLFGVYVHGAKDSLVKDNSITGLRGERLNETGNGVTVWNASGAKVVDNDISFGRDGIFVISSRNNVFSGNVMRKLRYAVHYMYAGDSEVTGNISIGNHIGFAISFLPGSR